MDYIIVYHIRCCIIISIIYTCSALCKYIYTCTHTYIVYTHVIYACSYVYTFKNNCVGWQGSLIYEVIKIHSDVV